MTNIELSLKNIIQSAGFTVKVQTSGPFANRPDKEFHGWG